MACPKPKYKQASVKNSVIIEFPYCVFEYNVLILISQEIGKY